MKIKHYTFFTDTHKIFLKYFLNTFPFDPEIDLQIRYMPQECKSGEFVTDGWKKTMERKVQFIVDAFDELKENDVFIHSDADVIFIQPYKEELLKELGNKDLIFQCDVGTACMGLFACKVNKNTKNLFQTLKTDLENHFHDQDAINYLLRNNNHNVDYGFFSHKFFNHGFLGKHYEGEDDVLFPQDMVMLHANFTVGIEKKVKLIQTALKHFKK